MTICVYLPKRSRLLNKNSKYYAKNINEIKKAITHYK